MAQRFLQLDTTTVADGLEYDVADREGEIGLDVNITGGTATVEFEGSINGVDFYALQGTPIGGGAAVTSATASGIFAFDVSAVDMIRARISAIVAATVNVRSQSSR